ncbi:MAG: hypothetical protein FD153_293 [Rhodospirillaceae bacterium]|nr:MAG: hypothetical protein FD153_293 [Rhodospirillaceae bacterium]
MLVSTGMPLRLQADQRRHAQKLIAFIRPWLGLHVVDLAKIDPLLETDGTIARCVPVGITGCDTPHAFHRPVTACTGMRPALPSRDVPTRTGSIDPQERRILILIVLHESDLRRSVGRSTPFGEGGVGLRDGSPIPPLRLIYPHLLRVYTGKS